MKMSPTGTPLHHRLLGIINENSKKGGDVTAAWLAGLLSAPLAEVEADLKALVALGNVIQVPSENGEAHYAVAPRRRFLGELLVELGLLTAAQLQEALAEQARTGERLGAILLARRYVAKQDLGRTLELQHGIPYVNLSAQAIDEQLVRSLPERLLMDHKVVPFARRGDEIDLAMLDPTDILASDAVGRYLKGHVRTFLITEDDFAWAVSKFFDVSRKVGESLVEFSAPDREETETLTVSVADTYNDPPVVRVVNTVLNDAVRIGATDIHIEPEADDTRIRVRVDGMLMDKASLPRSIGDAVASRLKVLAGMDIAERVRPQDGRMQFRVEDREYDMRIATLGTTFGERTAIRLLSTRNVLVGLDRLGLFPEQQELLVEFMAARYGMVLVTGPTGSGKTTTLYASLSHINQPSRNIMTIEDPVEYRLRGITQIQVREKAGVTFGMGLRAMLRHDPDVVMVGEVRDSETASIAVHAALTGHLVLSTLHTNSAAGAMVRLLDMGIEPYLLTSSLMAVIGQRLVRILCKACKRQYRAREEDLLTLGFATDADVALYERVGCPECGGLGYKGRTGVYEIIRLTDTVRDLVQQRKPEVELMNAARADGTQMLWEVGVRKVLDGVTTVEEMQRLISSEMH
ncbi:MAG TPA: GspE/PulE family protein [bacterium]|nr:GspE/PulE family protein [bacterium]